MANDNHNKYELDSPSNQNLSTLIDQDLQKESELLQTLIKEVVEANKKVKTSHRKRLDEANEKLSILNQEIKRLRQEINKKDEQTTMAQFDHLLKSKDRIHQALRTTRLHPLNSELKKDYEFSVHALKEKLFTHIEERSHLSKAPSSFMESFKTATASFVARIYAVGEATFKGENSLEVIKKSEVAFKEAASTFVQKLNNDTRELLGLLNSRDHILSDGSESTSLNSRVENTYKERNEDLKKKQDELKTTMKQGLAKVDEDLHSLRTKAEEELREKFKDTLEAQHKDKEILKKELKALKLDIIRAEKTGEIDELKTLLKTYNKKSSLEKGLSESKLQDKVEKKINSERKNLIVKKLELEKDYATAVSQLELDKNQFDLQFNDSHELFKVQDDYDALTKDLNLNQSLEDTLIGTTNEYETLLRETLTFTASLETLMFDTKISFMEDVNVASKKLLELKAAFKSSQIDLATTFKKTALKQNKATTHIQSLIRRQALNMHFHNEERKVNKTLTVATRTADIEKTYQQENAKNDLIYQHGLIELADKEYELQLLKIRSLYDNEMLLTKAQAERLNVGADVNETMVSTTLESQIHFSRQQIKYAENEYQVRLENIEAALKRELEYAKEKLNQRRQGYRSDIHELKNERDRKLSDLSYRQALFTDPKDKRKLREQEMTIRESYGEKIQSVEQNEANDDTVKRYLSQIEGAKNRAEKAKEDAHQLKEKTIKTFKNMLEQSDHKLNAFKDASGNEKLLGNTIEDEASQTAENRYNEAVEEAITLYKEKVNVPKSKIKQLKEVLDSIEFDENTQKTIDKAKKHLKEEKTYIKTTLDKEKQQTKDALKDIDDSIDSLTQKANDLQQKLSEATEDQAVKRVINANLEQIETLKKSRKSNEYVELEKSFNSHIAEHRDVLKKTKKSLDNTLKPALKEYERFLKKVSVSQNKTFKQLKKQKVARLKDTLKDIEARYSNQL
jgi:hypothetical protein